MQSAKMHMVYSPSEETPDIVIHLALNFSELQFEK